MATLVITVIGEDRPGLVSALADVVDEHGGSWGRSQLAQLAGTFAGIVTVDVAEDRVTDLTEALQGLQGVLDTSVRQSSADGGADAGQQTAPQGQGFLLDLVGHDRPGIVRQITGVLAGQGVSVETMETRVVPAPQAGGDLFEARASLRAPEGGDLPALQAALEDLARELQVDVTFDAEGQAAVWE